MTRRCFCQWTDSLEGWLWRDIFLVRYGVPSYAKPKPQLIRSRFQIALYDFQEYIEQPSPPRRTRATTGKQSDWLDFAELHLAHGKAWIIDTFFLAAPSEDGLLVELPIGNYILTAKCMEFAGDRRVSRMRALFQGVSTPVVGGKIGETWTDAATTTICDHAIVSRAWQTNPEAAAAKVQEAVIAARGGVIDLASEMGAIVPFVSSGFGDGTFPVYELLDGGRRVGVEIEFIAPDEKYPFPPAPEILAEEQREKAESGNALSQYVLGEYYRKGEGVPQDFEEALKWYRRAAEQNHEAAMDQIGNFHAQGRGTRQDFQQARAWYERAAALGHPGASNQASDENAANQIFQ